MKRFRRTLKFLSLGILGMTAIGLLANAIIISRVNSRLERKIATLREAGQPVLLTDLARPPISPETNAATYLARAKADVEAIQSEVSAAVDASPKADQIRFEQGHLSPAIKTAIQSALAAYPKVMASLELAAACPSYDPPQDLTVEGMSTFGNLSTTRAVIRVLNYRALLQLSEGQPEAAMRTCLLMFRICWHLDHEPMLVNFLIVAACRRVTLDTANLVLRSGPLPPATYEELEAELARHETYEPYRQTLSTERAFGLTRLRELGKQTTWGPFGLPFVKDTACDNIDLYDELLAMAGRPFAEASPALATSPTVARSGALTQSLVPSLEATIALDARIRAQLRALRVLNALARRPESAAAAAPALADLGLPAGALVDPFDGQTMHLKRLPDGWLVYAVGVNLKDDGGKIADLEDVGLGPASTSEKPRETEPAKVETK